MIDTDIESPNVHLGHLIVEITRAETEVEVYAAVARHLPHMTRANRVSVALFSPDRQSLEIMALHGTQGIMPVGMSLPAQESMVGKAARHNTTQIWRPDEASPFVDSVGLARQGLRSVINIPLRDGDQVLGCINLAAIDPDAFGEIRVGFADSGGGLGGHQSGTAAFAERGAENGGESAPVRGPGVGVERGGQPTVHRDDGS